MPLTSRLLLTLLAAVSAIGAGCSTTVETTSSAANDVETATTLSNQDRPGSTAVENQNEIATTPPSTVTSTTEPERDEMTSQDQQSPCIRLADFDSDDENRRWLVVNDDVMGGRSLGGLSFEGGTLIFEGEINTDGGGFSSLRLPLQAGALADHDRIEFRARPDSRSYMVTFDDDLASRDRRVSHRAPIEFTTPGQWETVSVSFDDLFPAVFGRPVDDLPFRKDLASRMGLMISDGVDGPFRLEVDWIDLCSR